MDTKGIYEVLKQLQTFRQQVAGLGLLPPDVTALLKFVEDAPAEVERLKEEKAQVQRELAQLRGEIAQLEPNLQRARAARAETDREEERLRSLKEGHEAFKRKIGVGV